MVVSSILASGLRVVGGGVGWDGRMKWHGVHVSKHCATDSRDRVTAHVTLPTNQFHK